MGCGLSKPWVYASCSNCKDKKCSITPESSAWMSAGPKPVEVSSDYVEENLRTAGMSELQGYLKSPGSKKPRIELRGDFCGPKPPGPQHIEDVRRALQAGNRDPAALLTLVNNNPQKKKKYALAECGEEVSTRDGKRVLVIHIFRGVPSGK